MTCPNCGEEMERNEYTEGNALFLSTKHYTYEYYKCPSCDYTTKHELIQKRGMTGILWKRDEDEDES